MVTDSKDFTTSLFAGIRVVIVDDGTIILDERTNVERVVNDCDVVANRSAIFMTQWTFDRVKDIWREAYETIKIH